MRIKYLLINVEGYDERLEDAKRQLDSQGLVWERLDAVTPKSDGFKMPDSNGGWYRDLAPNEVACYQSHRKAWQQALDEGYDYLVVLEDDLIVDHEIAPVVEAIINCDQSWDLVKLFETRSTRRLVTNLVTDPKIDLVDTPTVPIATTGYVIDCKVLERLIQHTEDFSRPIDVEMKAYWEMQLEIYSVYPPVLRIAEDNVSMIGSRENKLGLKSRLKKQYYHVLFSLKSKLRYFSRKLK